MIGFQHKANWTSLTGKLGVLKRREGERLKCFIWRRCTEVVFLRESSFQCKLDPSKLFIQTSHGLMDTGKQYAYIFERQCTLNLPEQKEI